LPAMFPSRNILPERRLRSAKCVRAGTLSGSSDMPVSASGTLPIYPATGAAVGAGEDMPQHGLSESRDSHSELRLQIGRSTKSDALAHNITRLSGDHVELDETRAVPDCVTPPENQTVTLAELIDSLQMPQ